MCSLFFVVWDAGVSVHFSCALELGRRRIWRGDAFWSMLFRGCAMGDGLCDTLTVLIRPLHTRQSLSIPQ